MNCDPLNQNRLTTPLLAMVETATLGDALFPEIPLNAEKLLRIVIDVSPAPARARPLAVHFSVTFTSMKRQL